MRLKEVSVLLVIILLGITLRVYHLGKKDFWYDEAWKLETSKDLKTCYLDNRPLFNFFLHFYLRSIPEKDEFSIRLLPAFFSILALPFFFLLARQIIGIIPSLFATFFLSISPIHIWYAQELRAYSLSAFLAILNAYLFLRAVKTDRINYFILFALSSILSSYTSYILLLLIIPEAIFLYYYYPKSSRKFLFSILFTVLFFSLRYYSFIYQFVFFTESFWTKPPMMKDFFISLENFNLGYNSIPVSYHFSLLLSLPFLVLPLKLREKEKRNFLLIFFLFPFIFSYLISFILPIFITRELFPLSPFYILLFSSGLSLIKRRNFHLIYSLLWIPFIAFSLLNHYSNLMPASFSYHVGTYPKMPYKNVIKLIKENYKSGDIIAHTNPANVSPFIYYLGRKKFKQFYFIIPEYQDKYWRRNILKWKVPKELSIPVIPPVNLSHKINFPYKRVWLISSDWARDWNIDINSKEVIKLMRKKYKLVYEKWIDGILVSFFVRKDSNFSTLLPHQ